MQRELMELIQSNADLFMNVFIWMTEKCSKRTKFQQLCKTNGTDIKKKFMILCIYKRMPHSLPSFNHMEVVKEENEDSWIDEYNQIYLKRTKSNIEQYKRIRFIYDVIDNIMICTL